MYVGVDYADYFACKCTAHRSTRYFKIYVATRTVHIEVVCDLTTDALIAAVLLMISRRGIPKAIYPDNGTNMVGAKNILSNQESLES